MKVGIGSKLSFAPTVSVSPISKVVDADHVSGATALHDRPLLRHERGGVREPDLLAGPHVEDLHAAFEPPRADAEKRQAISVRLVHVRLDLEYECAERRRRRDGALVAHPSARRGHQLAEGLEEGLEAEIVHRAAEEHRRQIARQEALLVEGVARRVEELGLVA